ncbi:MAG: glycosyltransferase family 87 protein [Pseudomonadota bacterium]
MRWLPFFLVAVGCGNALAGGLVGLSDSYVGYDYDVLRKAGERLLAGTDPWKAAMDDRNPFSYPPHIAPFVMLQAMLPAVIGFRLFVGLSQLALVVAATIVWVICRPKGGEESVLVFSLLLASLFDPYLRLVLFLGQTTAIIFSFMILGWFLLRRDYWFIAGILFGLASIKPQMSLLVIVWLIVDRQWRCLGIAVAFSIILALPALVQFGLFQTPISWLLSLEHYRSVSPNELGNQTVLGLPSLTAWLTGLEAELAYGFLGVFAITIIHRHWRSLPDLQVFNLIVLTSLTMFSARVDTLIAVSPIWLLFLLTAWRTGTVAWFLVGLVGYAVFYSFISEASGIDILERPLRLFLPVFAGVSTLILATRQRQPRFQYGRA